MSTPAVQLAARYVLALSLVLAAGILVKGYVAAGDGFAAGAVVAVALGLQILAFGRGQASTQPLLRWAGPIAIAGLTLAVYVAFFPLVLGDPPFTHLPPPGEKVAKIGSVELITAVAFDVGVFLLVMGALGCILALLSDPRVDAAEDDA